jgi:hypothetical protein
LIPLIIELNPAKLQLVKRQECKYALALIAYVHLEAWPFTHLPGASVRPQPTLQTFSRLAPDRLTPGGVCCLRHDGLCRRGFATLAGKKNRKQHYQ